MIIHGPTGNVIKGHVLDVNKKGFKEALKFLDPQLYFKWNPKKLKGWGCWEIRRRPNTKIPSTIVEYKGNYIAKLDYVEADWLHHVLDAAFLNYDIIRKLKEIDTWEKDHMIHDMEYHEEKAQEKIRKEAEEELLYNIKQTKKAWADLMQLVQEGHNPGRFLMNTDQ